LLTFQQLLLPSYVEQLIVDNTQVFGCIRVVIKELQQTRMSWSLFHIKSLYEPSGLHSTPLLQQEGQPVAVIPKGY